MTNLEKIEMVENNEQEISMVQEEIISRNSAFKAYVAKLTKEYEESNKKIKEKLNRLADENKQLGKEVISVSLADFLSEISKEYNSSYRITLSVMLKRPIIYYDEQEVIESINEKEILKGELSIYFPKLNDFIDFPYLSISLKQGDNAGHDCKIKMFIIDNTTADYNKFWTYILDYNLKNIILYIPLNLVLNDERLKDALFNCVKNETKQFDKPKSLIK